jgi:hypothetical protein
MVALPAVPAQMPVPGESRDPLINNSIGRTVGPGFRRECDLNWLRLGSEHSDLDIRDPGLLLSRTPGGL